MKKITFNNTLLEAHRLPELQNLRDLAFTAFSERGGYPVAQVYSDFPWEDMADQLNETIIRRVIQHDLKMGGRGIKRSES